MTAPTLPGIRTQRPSRTHALLTGALATLDTVSLPTVLQQAALQTRIDRKYLLPAHQVTDLVQQLRGRCQVLDIDSRRVHLYESVYFDTTDHALYRQHLQGRRRRYKLRTRTYLDTAECVFEVKLKERRSQTMKLRQDHPIQHRDTLTADSYAFLHTQLAHRYGNIPPRPALHPAVTTGYRRATLVDLAGGNRLTCDVDLTFRQGTHTEQALTDSVLIETKTTTGNSQADQTLHTLGHRPISLSKYCLAIPLLDPTIPANPWNRTLRRHSNWHPSRLLSAYPI